MNELGPRPVAPKPSPWFQFSLWTLLLLFVVLASSLGLFGAWGIVAFLFSVGLAVCHYHAGSYRPLQYLLVGLCPVIVVGLLMPTIGAQGPGRRTECRDNLHRIAKALQSYRQANGGLPPAYIADKNGKPMHSWRVLLLPYLDEDGIYKAYNFNEPWDGPNNKKVLNYPAPCYACPSDRDTMATGADAKTSYVAVVGPNRAWPSESAKVIGAAGSPGGENNIIMVIEVTHSGILWTEPKDLSIDISGTVPDDPFALVPSSNHGGGLYDRRDHGGEIYAAMADGSVRCLPPGILLTKIPGTNFKWPKHALVVWLLSVGAVNARRAE